MPLGFAEVNSRPLRADAGKLEREPKLPCDANQF